MFSVLTPGSVLLSANGSIAFKSCARYEDVASFIAPEVQPGHNASTRTAAEKPVQLSAQLEGLLLSMCEDVVVRRTDLMTLQDTCEIHHRAAMLPPPERLVDHVSMVENGSRLTDRSQIVRDRLHNLVFHQTENDKRIFPRLPSGGRHMETFSSWQQLNRIFFSPSQSKKGKSLTTQRELSVVMPNGQSILVKCEVKSRGGDVFDMVVAHSNLVEHFYFGLAYIDDNEFFFVDNDTKISKVAPDTWKKVPTTTFVLFFRVKFFVKDISHLHKQTRHQCYLQLRRDLLEDRLSCHEETALYLGALALQTDNYYRPDQYVSKGVMEKRALPYIQGELLRLHTNNAQMLPEESELDFLKLPEYGVFFHRVMREKKPLEGEIILGVCAKGIIVYEVKDGCRSTSQIFYWRETATISSNRRKFTVESRGSKKKYNFITERSKIATYLCNLCSAQHKFNNEMNSRQISQNLVSDENTGRYALVSPTQSSQLKSVSCSETPQDDSGLTTPQEGSLNKLCDDVTARIESRIKQQRLNEQSSPSLRSPACSQRSGPEAPSCSPTAKETPTRVRSSTEREVICVTLKKDPKLGLGILIVGEDTVGHYDLGIFVASIVPGGPADKDGRIRPGGRMISLNHISLEGVTFSEAAEVMQSSPEEGTSVTDGSSEQDGLDEIVSVMMTPKTSNRLNVPREVRAQDNCCLSPPPNCVRPLEISVELRKISGRNTQDVTLTKCANGLGFSFLMCELDPPIQDFNSLVRIKTLFSGQPAQQSGRIEEGDRVLKLFKTSPAEVTLTLSRPAKGILPTIDQFTDT
ncbi:hypothetical protein F7725_013940 [Dissostichus mawsoni]|uniref:FERM and PDZ domain-containing protein 2 n=1 Tax=Dissostichus mawsoni TaxID=36200 RepID=A0A7J5YUJ4_DISMA|nr:hypothetical protein F7725_013940 [Dissostichus mawsoni]